MREEDEISLNPEGNTGGFNFNPTPINQDFNFNKQVSDFDFDGGLSVAEEKINPSFAPLGYDAKQRIKLEKELDRKQTPAYMVDALKLDSAMNFLLDKRINIEEDLKTTVFQNGPETTFQQLSYLPDPTKGLIKALGIDDKMIAEQYPGLTKKDVYNAVESKFWEQVEIEAEKKKYSRASKQRFDIIQENGDFEDETSVDKWLRERVVDDSKTFTNKIDLQIANLMLQIDDGFGDTPAEKTKIQFEIKKLKDQRDPDDRFHLLDLTTGDVYHTPVGTSEKRNSDKTRFPLMINTRISELRNRAPEMNTRDYLKQQYEQSILAHVEVQDEFEKQYNVVYGKNKPVVKTMKELLFDHDRGVKFSVMSEVGGGTPYKTQIWDRLKNKAVTVEGETDQDVDFSSDFGLVAKALREDLKQYTIDRMAYKRMFLLNEGVEGVKRFTTKDLIKNTLNSFEDMGFYGKAISKIVNNTTEIDKITGFSRAQGALGIEMTQSEKEYVYDNWKKDAFAEFGGAARFLVELWGAGKVLKLGKHIGMAVPRINQFSKWLKGTKSYYDYATAISMAEVSAVEGLKFYAAEGRIAGHYDATAALKGATFGMGSFAAGKFMGNLFKGVSKRRAGLMNYLIASPVTFNTSVEFSELANAVYKEWNGSGSIRKYIDDNYGDLSVATRRIIENGMFSYSLGFGKQAKAMWEFGKLKEIQFAKDELFMKINDMVGKNRGKGKNYISKKEINKLGFWHPNVQQKIKKNLTEKELKTFSKLSEAYSDVLNRIEGIDYVKQYYDIKTGRKAIKAEHKKTIEENKKDGNILEVEVITQKTANRRDKGKSEKYKKYGNAKAITEPTGKNKYKVTYILEQYFPGVKHHELLHFEMFSKFGKDARLKEGFFENLQNIAEQITLGEKTTDMGTAISKKTGEQITLKDVLEAKFGGEKSQLKEWEYFSYIGEFMSKPSNYYKIREAAGFYKFKNLLTDFFESMDPGRRYDMNLERDVVRFFSDYMNIVKGGKSTAKMHELLDNFVVEPADAIANEGAASAVRELKSENLTKTIDTKELSKDLQKDYEKLIEGGQGKDLKEKNQNILMQLTDPARNPDAMYPVAGGKIGPWIDAAIYKYNLKVPEKYRIELGEGQRGGDRYDLVTDIVYGDKRGFQDFMKNYDPAKGKLSTYITGQTLLRLQEIKGRSIDLTSEAKANPNTVVSSDKTTPEGTGILDKITAGGGGTNAEILSKQTKSGANEGIQLRNFEFKNANGRKFTLNTDNVKLIENKYREIFQKDLTKEDTYAPTTEAMRVETSNAVNEIFGIIPEIHKTPKSQVEAAIPNIKANGKMMYSSMPKTSSPDFYENSQIAKSIFKVFYKKMLGADGKPIKYKTNELSAAEAKRTNARTVKYEKLPVTPERVQQFVELITTGRDAGTILKKINMAKQYIGDVLGSQVSRDMLDVTTPSGAEFKTMVDNNPALKSKYELMKMDLAIKRLRGATPEGLKSENITENQANKIIEQIKGEKDITPMKLYNIVSSNLVDKDAIEKLLKGTGNFEGDVVELFRKEVEAKRFLTGGKDIGPMPIRIFGEKYAGFTKEVAEFFKKNKIGAFDKQGNPIGLDMRSFSERVNDANFIKEYQTEFLPNILGKFSTSLLGEKGMIANSFTMTGKFKFGGSDTYFSATERNKIIKNIKGVVGELPWLEQVKLTDNTLFRGFVQKKLLSKAYKNINKDPKVMEKFVNEVRDYLTPKQKKGGEKVTLEQTIAANRKLQKYVYSRLYDYYYEAVSKNPAHAKKALNHISFLLQAQTNIGGGFTRATATHISTTTILGTKKVVKKKVVDASDPREGSFLYSEHALQAMNFNLNFMDAMIKSKGNKKEFDKMFDAMSKQYHQTIITKEANLGVDADGTVTYRAKDDIRVDSRSNAINDRAEMSTIVDLRTGKNLYDMATGITQAKEVVLKLNNQLKKGLGLKSDKISETNQSLLRMANNVEKAFTNGRNIYQKSTGMSTFDFDETLIIGGNNFVTATKDGKTIKISSAEWPTKGTELAAQGWKMDFKDFVNVRGGVEGPLMQKLRNQIEKYGVENVFVLTARQQQAAPAIYGWLKSKGIDIPIENITGLGNSTGEAKAMWMLEKFSQGYNDMYFVDDAMSNVKAVKNVLEQLDIKSKVVQARILKSETLASDMNTIISEVTGIEPGEISKVKGRLLGRKKYTKSFIVPSAQDFKGLLQNFQGKGKRGEAHQQFFNEHLHDPYSRAHRDITAAEQSIVNDYTALGKLLPGVKKKLNKTIPDQPFTYDQAVRVHRWTEAGFEIPGLNKADIKMLNEVVLNDPMLLGFSNNLSAITKLEAGYTKPREGWEAGSIVSDLHGSINSVGREKYFAEFRQNRELIFGEWKNGKLEGPNMAKIEATQGPAYVEALNDILWRMETGSNRPAGKNKAVNMHMNFINGSVGATMWFNTRSATLQTLSTLNYINWSDNNPVKAAAAFANQKQYWSDFAYIFNSDMLQQRRSGLKYNVSESELAQIAAGDTKNSARKVFAYLIKKGFAPTQIADSFAISAGGATFYRNRIKKYINEGFSGKEAKEKAFLDFQETTETAQQSARPDLISPVQAGPMGRLVFAWGNTPMQYARIQEKAIRDIANGRGDTKANLSKIAYYGFIQSAAFTALQNAMFAFGMDSEDSFSDDAMKQRTYRAMNNMVDTQLRGIGIPGAIVSTVKNTVVEYQKQKGKGYNADQTKTMLQLLSYSPVLGSKFRKIFGYSGTGTFRYNQAAIDRMGLNIDNPSILAYANVIEASTNLPTARLMNKMYNLRIAADMNNQWWQRAGAFGGWSGYDLGVENTAVEDVKRQIKIQKKMAPKVKKPKRPSLPK